MRSSNPRLGEMTIKVPAPFAGISDLGFTAQYRAQQFNEASARHSLPHRRPPAPDAPSRRAPSAPERIRFLRLEWSDPVMLSDEVVVLAFRDRIAKAEGSSRTEPASPTT